MTGVVGFRGTVADPREALDALSGPLARRPYHRPEHATAPGMGIGRIAGVLPPRAPGPRRGDGGIAVLLEGVLVEREAALAAAGPEIGGARDDLDAVLALYRARGPAGLRGLAGEFVLAVLDPERGAVVVASDRFGLHPVYVWRRGDRLAFASEVGVLVRFLTAMGWDRPSLDPVAVADAVVLGAVLEERSLAAGIERLPAGAVLTADADGVRLSLAPVPPRAPRPPGVCDPDRDVPATLERALARRLPEPGTRVGCFLSGGLDTRALAAGLARGGTPFTSLTFVRPGSLDGALGPRVAAALGVPARTVPLPPVFPLDRAQEVADLTSGLGALPLAAFAATHGDVRDAAAVVFSGSSGDAVFGSLSLPEGLSDPTDAELAARVLPPLPARLRARILAPDLRALPDTPPAARLAAAVAADRDRAPGLPAAARLDRLNLDLRQRRRTLEGVRVRRVDSDVRIPFWDGDLVDLALALHPALRRAQAAYVRALAAWLPAPVAAVPWSRTGLPVGTPVPAHAPPRGASRWRTLTTRARRLLALPRPADPRLAYDWNAALRTDPALLDWLRDLFSPPSFATSGLLSPEGLRAVLDDTARGRRDDGDALGRAASVELWARKWIAGR